MDLKLSGKRALVTGSSRGIGLAIAELLAAEGCELVLTARNSEELELAFQRIGRDRARVITADLTRDDEVARLASEAGDLDILVNNAGAVPPGTLQDIDLSAWRAGWDLKVYGYIALTQAVYRGMAARAGGVIVNVIGAAAEWLPPAFLPGAVGNAALVAFTKTVGKASHEDGIRIVGVNPGMVGTQRAERLFRDAARRQFGDEERWREFTNTKPFKRLATVDEIASAVAFLASPRSGYTSGTVLTIDGGG
jgi:NAD(P)-dependent dehydrogenase (short-subunit alcohol dehydrogenase family)